MVGFSGCASYTVACGNSFGGAIDTCPTALVMNNDLSGGESNRNKLVWEEITILVGDR
jgi:hypothetical protein